MARGRENAAIEEAAHAVAAMHFHKRVSRLTIDGYGGGECKWDHFPSHPQNEVLISDVGPIAVQMFGTDPDAQPSMCDMDCANAALREMSSVTPAKRQAMFSEAGRFVFEHQEQILALKKLLYPGGIVTEHDLTLAVFQVNSPLKAYRYLYQDGLEAVRKLEETLKAGRQQWNKERSMEKNPHLYTAAERREVQQLSSSGASSRVFSSDGKGFKRVECCAF